MNINEYIEKRSKMSSVDFVKTMIMDKVHTLSSSVRGIKSPLIHGCAQIVHDSQHDVCTCVFSCCFYPPVFVLYGVGFCLVNVLSCCTCNALNEKIKVREAEPFTLSDTEKLAIDLLLKRLENIRKMTNVDDAVVACLDEAMTDVYIVKLHSFLDQLRKHVVDMQQMEFR